MDIRGHWDGEVHCVCVDGSLVHIEQVRLESCGDERTNRTYSEKVADADTDALQT